MKTIVSIASLSIALAAVAGCSGTTTGREPDEYTGCGTDETWRTFEDQEPMAISSAAQAPFVTTPAGVVSSPFKLTWQPDQNDVGAPDGDVPHDANSCPEYNTGSLSTLHLPPISGDAYDLQLIVDGKVAWRVITTLQEWGAPDATLAMWKNKNVEVKIWRMSVLRNDLKEGPFVSLPFAFGVAP